MVLFPFFWHPNTWGWIADTQQTDSLSCLFACAMFVGRRDVYTGVVPKGLLSGGILGGGKSQPIPGKPIVVHSSGARAARILSRSWFVHAFPALFVSVQFIEVMYGFFSGSHGTWHCASWC